MTRNEDIAWERADIALWSMPLIADCIEAGYRACLGDNDRLVRQFTNQHRQLWKQLVDNDRVKAKTARATLDALAKICSLTDEALYAIDDIVIDELIDVVARRYRGSASKTRTYNRILVDAASVLTQSRLAA